MAQVIARFIPILADDEAVHPAVDHQRRQRAGGLLIHGDPNVQNPPDGLRITARAPGRLVDALIRRDEIRRLHVPKRRDPAVREPAGDGEHPRLVGAEPDAHLVRRLGTRVDARQRIEVALEPDVALAAPHEPDDLDRFLERRDRLARRPHRSAHGLDRVPESACAHAELGAATAEDVQRCCRLRQHRGRAHGQAGDIWENSDSLGSHRDCDEQGPRVVEAPLVGMVLHADQVEAELVSDGGDFEGAAGLHGRRDHEDAELDLATVVHEISSWVLFHAPAAPMTRPSAYVTPPTITPASVISNPADHQRRSVNSDFEAPTRKCATRETMKATITPVVPRRKKKGITGTIAPTKVLMPAAAADWRGSPPASTPPSSSVAWAMSIACGFFDSLSASMSAVSVSKPFSW